MEIKIVNESSRTTRIVEGTDISYEFIYCNSSEEFCNIHNDRALDLPGYLEGMDDFKEGRIVLLYYKDKNNEINFIIATNSVIYITNNGVTIDKVIV